MAFLSSVMLSIAHFTNDPLTRVIEEDINGQARADALLTRFNKKTRTLRATGVLGDLRVRAGSTVMVNLDVGDIILSEYMVVDSVCHIFGDNQHLMKLKLSENTFKGMEDKTKPIEPTNNTYTVIFNPGEGGKGTPPKSVTQNRWHTIILPGPGGLSNEDAFFDGWSMDGADTIYFEGQEIAFSESVELIAQWATMEGGERF